MVRHTYSYCIITTIIRLRRDIPVLFLCVCNSYVVLPIHHQTYKKITGPENKDIVPRNVKLIKLPFDGISEFVAVPDQLNIHSFRQLFVKYNFKSFLRNESFQEWSTVFNLL